jgi:hypothetical protein
MIVVPRFAPAARWQQRQFPLPLSGDAADQSPPKCLFLSLIGVAATVAALSPCSRSCSNLCCITRVSLHTGNARPTCGSRRRLDGLRAAVRHASPRTPRTRTATACIAGGSSSCRFWGQKRTPSMGIQFEGWDSSRTCSPWPPRCGRLPLPADEHEAPEQGGDTSYLVCRQAIRFPRNDHRQRNQITDDQRQTVYVFKKPRLASAGRSPTTWRKWSTLTPAWTWGRAQPR